MAGCHFLKHLIETVDTNDVSVTPSQFEMLRSTLDAMALRHRVASQNLANVNTPGYRAQEVQFEEPLIRQLQLGNVDWKSVAPKLQDTLDAPVRQDGNNVDLDREVTELNKSATLYEAYAQLMATKLAMMRSAITGR